MDQQQSEPVRGQFAPGHGKTSTEWMQRRFWITPAGRRALVRAQTRELDVVRRALAGGQR